MAVVKVIELMADSPVSWEDAAQVAIAKASKTISNIRAAYIKDHSVTVSDGKVTSYRVTLKISFEVE